MANKKKGLLPLVIGAIAVAVAVILSDEKNRAKAKKTIDEAKKDPQAFSQKTVKKAEQTAKEIAAKAKAAAAKAKMAAEKEAKIVAKKAKTAGKKAIEQHQTQTTSKVKGKAK